MRAHVTETTYDLSFEEVGEVEFKVRFICDRQEWKKHPLQFALEEHTLNGSGRLMSKVVGSFQRNRGS